MGSQDGDWAEAKTGNAGHYAHEVWDAPRHVGEDSWVGGFWCVSWETCHRIPVIYTEASCLCLLPCVDAEVFRVKMKHFIPVFCK